MNAARGLPPSDARGDEQRAIAQRLSQLHGPGELRAALLALVRTPGSGRELQAWREHTQGIASAEAVRNDIGEARRRRAAALVRSCWPTA